MQATGKRSLAAASRLLQQQQQASSSSSASIPRRAVSSILTSVSTRKTRASRERAAARKGKGRDSEDGDDNVTYASHVTPEDPAVYLKTVTPSPSGEPLDLAKFHRFLDIHPELYENPSPGVRTVSINSTPLFPRPSPEVLAQIRANSMDAEGSDSLADLASDATTRLTMKDLRQLHRYPLVVKRVVNMTSKGKQPSMYALCVAGNGNGLLGYGEGKDETVNVALDKAFAQAVKNMDYVVRKEDRTTWADEMKGKWGATRVELRSRPPGFGLRTSPIIHQIAKAAGISDLSAKVRGSRNGMNTVKATISLLHGGAAPIGLGDISGNKLARRFKGQGMRTAQEIGLGLGRRAIELR